MWIMEGGGGFTWNSFNPLHHFLVFDVCLQFPIQQMKGGITCYKQVEHQNYVCHFPERKSLPPPRVPSSYYKHFWVYQGGVFHKTFSSHFSEWAWFWTPCWFLLFHMSTQPALFKSINRSTGTRVSSFLSSLNIQTEHCNNISFIISAL